MAKSATLVLIRPVAYILRPYASIFEPSKFRKFAPRVPVNKALHTLICAKFDCEMPDSV